MNKINLIIILLVTLISCEHKEKESTAKLNIGLNLSMMDTTVKPQNDFYNYVNGQWMKTAKIPSDRTSWGSFDKLRKDTDINTLKILNAAITSNQYKEGTDQRKAINYYISILDTIKREKEGAKPILPFIKEIQRIQTKEEVLDFMIKNEPYFNSSFFGISISADMKNSNRNLLYLHPAGLGLPDRDYYVNKDKESKKLREQYQEHIANMLHFLNSNKNEIEKAKKDVLTLETQLAKAQLTKEERRKPENSYNPRKLKNLKNKLNFVNIEKYIHKLGIELDTLIVTQPVYLAEVNKIFQNNDIQQIKNYMIWTTYRGVAGNMSPTISNANWTFYGKVLNGQKERKPLEERALSTVNWSIGEAVGKLYVEKMFPSEAKTKAKEMVSYLQKAYKQRITDLPWMSEETKLKAKEKVSRLQIKIGYPNQWKDYSKLEVKEANSYFQNAIQVSQWHFKEELAKLNKPVDKTEWHMAPQVVNAYYNPGYNEIVFPAAILQPPFYDYRADEAVNYGAMGAVIGHEISHGFDDQGAKFNAEGNLENWWTKEDFKAFNILGKKLNDQYSKVEVLPGVFVNGDFTLGENIGDLGGVNAAFTALDLFYKDHKKSEKVQGFTPEERFFMSWTTVWRSMILDKALKTRIKTDPHAPGKVRATLPLQNVDAFYEAFSIKKGDGMYLKPEDRVKIW